MHLECVHKRLVKIDQNCELITVLKQIRWMDVCNSNILIFKYILLFVTHRKAVCQLSETWLEMTRQGLENMFCKLICANCLFQCREWCYYFDPKFVHKKGILSFNDNNNFVSHLPCSLVSTSTLIVRFSIWAKCLWKIW